jgi:hypothetical protein
VASPAPCHFSVERWSEVGTRSSFLLNCSEAGHLIAEETAELIAVGAAKVIAEEAAKQIAERGRTMHRKNSGPLAEDGPRPSGVGPIRQQPASPRLRRGTWRCRSLVVLICADPVKVADKCRLEIDRKKRA